MQIISIRNIKNLAGKTAFLRADLNIGLNRGAIKDDFKIIQILPTIRFLLRQNCRIIIATHLSDNTATTKPIAKRLKELLDRKVLFMEDSVGDKLAKKVKAAKARDIILLENLRFDRGEEDNSKKFAKALASLADLYINDAFASSHRDHASVSAIKKYLPSYAGLLLEQEIINLEKILNPRQPLISIVGGAKIETKIALLNNLARKSERVLIGGAVANDFIAAHGFKIGRSLFSQASVKLAGALIKRHHNIILPIDVIVAKKINLVKLGRGELKSINSSQVQAKPVGQIKANETVLDIGPRTVKLFAGFIREANTIIWNGPLGFFENAHFKHGTLAIARLVAARSTGRAFGVVGGGETIEALRLTGMEHYIDWISTGGGAMLAFLGGEPMPGLKGIVK